MKKPKKTTVAKPLSRRATSSRIKPGAKAVKAPPAKKPKKAVAKKARKMAVKTVKPAAKVKTAKAKPAVNVKFKAKTRPAIQAESAVEKKLSVKEFPAKVRPAAQAKSASRVSKSVAKVKPAAEAELSAKAKVKAAALVKSAIDPKLEVKVKPGTFAKPDAKAKQSPVVQVAPRVVISVKPPVEVEPLEKPVVQIHPVGDAKPQSKVKPVANIPVKSPLTARAEVKAKSEAPAKPIGKAKPSAPIQIAPQVVIAVKPPIGVEPLEKPVAEVHPVSGTKPKLETKAPAAPKTVTELKPPAAVVLPAKTESDALVKSAIETKLEVKAKLELPVKPVAKIKRSAPRPVAPQVVIAVKPLAVVEPLGKPAAEIHPLDKSKAKAKFVSEMKQPVEPKPSVETKLEKQIPPRAVPEMKRAPRPGRKTPERIPAILLEGDQPPAPPISGPGQRYALGPMAPVEKLKTEGELPESYGTGAILLTARDPHWLYTHWDLSGDQQRRYNAFSRDGHMIVRIYVEAARGKPVVQIHVHPESRHWFVHVDQANTRYVAELGYYSAADKWTVVSTSTATLTPPDAVSADTSAEFGTIPFEVPMEKLLSLVKEAVQENAPLARALQELRADGHPELPPMDLPKIPPASADVPSRSAGKLSAVRWTPSEWTPAQERALAAVISMDQVRRVWMGSLEITELIRRQFIQELASMTAAELGALPPGGPTSPTEAVTGITSPGASAAQLSKGFWFNVNAELIVYGATERDATVSIGGRKIKLRPDGSFSYRFALPDGNYEMPVVAISADQTDGRAAEMKFSRNTEYRGDVGEHPQDPSLQPLSPENF